MNNFKRVFFTISILFSLSVGNVSAQGKSMKVIDFEGDVVEGINKQSLDSLNQISEEEKRRRRGHLYQKRQSFKSEDQDLIGELRLQQ